MNNGTFQDHIVNDRAKSKSPKAFNMSKLYARTLVIATAIFIGSHAAAAPMRKVSSDSLPSNDSSALNLNFDVIKHETENSVHKSSTETIHGYKYFKEPVSFTGISASTVTASSGTFTTATITTLTGTTLTETSASIGAITANSVVVSTLTASSATITALSMGGVLNMQSHKITNLTNGSSAQDGAAFGQIPLVATQAQQEAASISTAWAAPSVQQSHPSAAKAWAIFSGTGTVTLMGSYNVTSITDNGTGDYTVNFTTAFSSKFYACVCSPRKNSGGGNRLCEQDNTAYDESSIRLETFDTGGTAQDADRVHIICFGDQ